MLGFFRLVSAPLYEQLRLILIRTILRDKFSRYYYLVGIEQLGQKKKGSVICRSTLRCRPAYHFVLSTITVLILLLRFSISHNKFEY